MSNDGLAQANPAPLKIVAGANMKALINSNLKNKEPVNKESTKKELVKPVPVKTVATLTRTVKAPVLAKAQAHVPLPKIPAPKIQTPLSKVKLSATIPTKTITKIESIDDSKELSKSSINEKQDKIVNDDESDSDSLKKILKKPKVESKATPKAAPKVESKATTKKTDKLDYSDDSSDDKKAKNNDSDSESDVKSESDMSNSSGMGLKGNTNLRGPGRPRKSPQIDDLPVQGIVDKPDSDKNKMEMRYGNPTSLKKIFMLLKSMDPEELHIYFEKDKFTIKARDHLEKSNVYVEAYGKNMNKYYCEKPFAISLESEAIAKIFQTMDNTHHAIQFISRKRAGDDINLYIIMIDRVRNRHDNYEIKVKGGSPFKGLDKEVNCKNYPIQFTLESKDFKKMISKIALHTDKFTIQKKGNEDLRISTQQSKKTGVKCNFVYKDAADIKLKSKIGKNDLFSVAINTKYIKNFAKAQLGDEICIHADSFKPTIFEVVLDYNEAHKNYTFRIVDSTETFKYKAIKD